ncbi:ABC-ATPase domain-containing protein [Brevibacterium spongiae]|uniref:ABC-ATPase domain-containing protein n=1 Tax=Brevibacterium spongiae TaxID=2909672 RepID=A0ABY5SV42_9MICO|nr:ABC-ATPase domain-containing protein [Brevibacterium spongiae]UVI36574.1 ABC-ATPase domain-containing protein [Brevibacterium spongiae]
MSSHQSNLASTLHGLDGRSYGNLKQIRGRYVFGPVTVFIDRIQADPFASPSKVRVRVDRTDAQFPPELTTDRADRIAASDYLLRAGNAVLERLKQRTIILGRPGQEILERTNILIDDKGFEARLLVNLPARGRRVLGHQAADILTRDLPEFAERLFLFEQWSDADAHTPTARRLADHVQLHRDQLELRRHLGETGLIGFVGNGAILPRSSGDSDLPMDSRTAITFTSPPELEHTVELSSGRRLTGMGIPRGVTVIVGGGYHGKSTILRALERGVYPHIAGDGREWVISDPTATSIRAEDGRAVTGDDISAFINNLPSGTDTRSFSTTNASGSTSQAANLVEAIEAGARTLLIDEDTSATNFMIRDERMRALIPAEREPITPFVDRVRPLLTRQGVSTVLVAGGSSAFFEVADHVIALDAYFPRVATEQAHELVGITAEELSRAESPHTAEENVEPTTSINATGIDTAGVDAAETHAPDFSAPPRIPTAKALRPASKTKSARAKGSDRIQFGKSFIDLIAVAQLVDTQQASGVAEALEYLAEIFDGRTALTAALAEIDAMLDDQGIDGLTGHRDHPGHLTRPRTQEIAAALNRYRELSLSR